MRFYGDLGYKKASSVSGQYRRRATVNAEPDPRGKEFGLDTSSSRFMSVGY